MVAKGAWLLRGVRTPVPSYGFSCTTTSIMWATIDSLCGLEKEIIHNHSFKLKASLSQNLDSRRVLVGAVETKPQAHVFWLGPLVGAVETCVLVGAVETCVLVGAVETHRILIDTVWCDWLGRVAHQYQAATRPGILGLYIQPIQNIGGMAQVKL